MGTASLHYSNILLIERAKDTLVSYYGNHLLWFPWQLWKYFGCYSYRRSSKDILVTLATMEILGPPFPLILLGKFVLFVRPRNNFEVTSKRKVVIVIIATMEILRSHSLSSASASPIPLLGKLVQSPPPPSPKFQQRTDF